ncbi:MAG: DUF6538 domain-containing protein [Sulfuriferula sp.]
MPKQTYLHKRLKSAVYYFRCRIPNDLISSYDDKREISFNLKTRDHHEAMRRVSIEAGKLQTEFEKLRRSLVNAKNPPKQLNYTDDEIERLSLLWTRWTLETDDQQRLEGYVDESFDEQAERLIDTDQDLKKIYARGELEKIYPALNGFLALTHTVPPDDPVAYRRLAMSFLKAAMQAIQSQLARQNGEIVETDTVAPADKVYVVQPDQTETGTSSPLELGKLLQNWRVAVAQRAPATIESYTAAIREFNTWVKNIPANKITRQQVIGFRDYLLKEREQNPKTVEKKIGILSSVLQLAVDDELLPANPAQRIKIPKPKNAPKPRIAYSEADMQQILDSPLYAAESVLPRGGKGEAARWLPVLGMFTGARLEELAQLHVADLQHDPQHGWYLHITEVIDDDEDGKKTQADATLKKCIKTESSRRRIPLHPELVRVGFVRFIERLRKAGQARVFPQLTPDSKGKYSAAWSKWWGRYARQKIGITARRKVFHSMRHSFKDACREVGIAEELSDAITGHKEGSTGRSYGNEQFPLGPLARAMALFAYPNVTVPMIEVEMDLLAKFF